jgi:hypothetical protein
MPWHTMVHRVSQLILISGNIPVHYLGREQFITNKRATGRKKDLADLESLGEVSDM